jgi:hypothetical protein
MFIHLQQSKSTQKDEQFLLGQSSQTSRFGLRSLKDSNAPLFPLTNSDDDSAEGPGTKVDRASEEAVNPIFP